MQWGLGSVVSMRRVAFPTGVAIGAALCDRKTTFRYRTT